MSLSVKELRASFLEYFGGHGHEVMPSSPLVPQNDPTLMFTNAGMVQFKDIFTGKQARPAPAATTSQKCVRAGGKHNDLDNVGYTARHHTFFEMLGNFSFGDYFKEQAIEHAWTLLTKEWGLDKSKLSFTVYHDDDEAYDLWKKISGCSDDKILRIATSDNFWAMGDTGPCGPCSEIFYDHGEGAAEGAWALDANGSDLFGDRFIEIWNLVFMQYEQTEEGRTNLPKPSIDTGMGLERIAAVMQGVHDNYEIDLFQNLIGNIESITSTKRSADNYASYKVIADHLRSSAFLIADGVMPSNEGRGYVLRRIMRRAMRHAHHLNPNDVLMHQLVPSLLSEMGGAFPELNRAEALMTETLRAEEQRFRTTLERGLKLLESETGKLASGAALPGAVAFKLYDTYGFPVDLTADILRGQNKQLDEAGFEAAMAEQKARARAAWSGSGEAATDAAWFDLLEQHGATEFLGYSQTEAQGSVIALINEQGEAVQSAKAGERLRVLMNQTPFYGESGGQMGDAGDMLGDGFHMQVKDSTKPLPELIVHHAYVTDGEVSVGDVVQLRVDAQRRNAVRANHSATHIVHKALRDQLGEHVTQKGSLVAPERLRFDFSHSQAVTAEELRAVEAQVNAVIWQNDDVSTKVQTPEAAIEAGAMALFGEKYGDEVRVVSMGLGQSSESGVQSSGNATEHSSASPSVSASERSQSDQHLSEVSKPNGDNAYSVELCGGTHVERTGDIGLFVIVSESSVAAGIRRIEAVTGAEALKYLHQQQQQLVSSAHALKCAPAELPERLKALQDERKQLQQQLSEAKKQLAMGGSGASVDAPEEVNGVKFLFKQLDDVSPKDLKPLADQFKKQLGSGVVLLVSGAGGKASIVAGVTEDLIDRISAVDLVRAGSEAAGGKGGGGRADMAQAGGPHVDAGAIFDAVKGKIAA